MQNPKRLANPQISPISPVLKFDCFEIRQPQNKSIEWPLERIWICAWDPWIIQWKMYSTPNLRSAPSTEETLTSIFGCPDGGGASHLKSVNQIHSNDLKRNPCLPETKRSTRPYQQMQVAKLATCTSQFMFNDGNSNSSLFSNQENESMLVGGFNHLEKYESQWEGWSHILWKIPNMFETTNQQCSFGKPCMVFFLFPKFPADQTANPQWQTSSSPEPRVFPSRDVAIPSERLTTKTAGDGSRNKTSPMIKDVVHQIYTYRWIYLYIKDVQRWYMMIFIYIYIYHKFTWLFHPKKSPNHHKNCFADEGSTSKVWMILTAEKVWCVWHVVFLLIKSPFPAESNLATWKSWQM